MRALVIVMRNLRVFGHFSDDMLFQMLKDIEDVDLKAGENLFKVGDYDENMFIVVSEE